MLRCFRYERASSKGRWMVDAGLNVPSNCYALSRSISESQSYTGRS